MTLATLMRSFEYAVLVSFGALAFVDVIVCRIGLRAISRDWAGRTKTAFKDLLANDYYEAVSILVPAHNEEASIIDTVRSLLNLSYPDFEVIVSNDGSTDGTLPALIGEFELLAVPIAHDHSIRTRFVRGMFRSSVHPNLTVIDKLHGGRSDAIDAAFNVARRPLVCIVDADSTLDADALVRASIHFVESEEVIAVYGAMRPLDGSALRAGAAGEMRAPNRWIEHVQVVEYARALLTAGAAWSRLRCLTITTGAFGVFRRSAIHDVGGWPRRARSDDMCLRLHEHFLDRRLDYAVVFTADPICWTRVPSTFRSLVGQRLRWARRAIRTLSTHRRMLLRARFGRVGLLALPYEWLSTACAPVVETIVYAYLVASAVLGRFDPSFAIAFVAITSLFAILSSQLSISAETIVRSRIGGRGDRVALLAAALVEQIGIRQVLTVVRCVAVLRPRARPVQPRTDGSTRSKAPADTSTAGTVSVGS